MKPTRCHVEMKLVMINDCSSVGETLLKYLPVDIEKQHIKRTRGLWSKTVSVGCKILRSKGDIYHSNYLLQDCYVAIRLGKKPILGWGLGSDIRASLKHPLWSGVVRYNLKNCNRVLVSTPDILTPARRYRDDAEYFPPRLTLDSTTQNQRFNMMEKKGHLSQVTSIGT